MVKRKAKRKAATKKKVAAKPVIKRRMGAVELTFEVDAPITKKRDWKPGIYNARIIEVKPIKKKKQIKRKESKYWLTNRTKLTDEQMKRAKIEAAGGQDQKYVEQKDGSFKQSLPLTQAMAKAFSKAQKFVLYDTNHVRPIYVAAKKEVGITFDLEEARLFADGFDDPTSKAAHFGKLFNLAFKFHRIHIKPDQIKLAEPQKLKEESKDSSDIPSDGQFMHDQNEIMHDPNDDI